MMNLPVVSIGDIAGGSLKTLRCGETLSFIGGKGQRVFESLHLL